MSPWYNTTALDATTTFGDYFVELHLLSGSLLFPAMLISFAVFMYLVMSARSFSNYDIFLAVSYLSVMVGTVGWKISGGQLISFQILMVLVFAFLVALFLKQSRD